jgi:hypothetical protein
LSNIIKTRKRPDRDSTEACAALIGERVARSWSPWLLTLMLHQIAGSSALVQEHMRGGVERFYATLLTRVVRRPGSPSSLDSLPVLVGTLGLPVRKRAKFPLSDWGLNGGLHRIVSLLGERLQVRGLSPRHGLATRHPIARVLDLI